MGSRVCFFLWILMVSPNQWKGFSREENVKFVENAAAATGRENKMRFPLAILEISDRCVSSLWQ